MKQSFSRSIVLFLFGLISTCGIISCTPKEEIVFKGVKNVVVQAEGVEPVLTAEALFNNPNKERMKLKEIHVDVLVDGKLSAKVRQDMKLLIPAMSDFSVPLTARLSLKELGLVDTILNLIGGKKYEIQYIGFVRVAVHGITVKVPVKYKEERRIQF
jgi:LEA14-like dessication related protein